MESGAGRAHNAGMETRKLFYALAVAMPLVAANSADACTGITLKSDDGGVVVARTIDWSREEMDNIYIVVPRGQVQTAILPNNAPGGMQYTAKYGYVGLGMEQAEFIVDGTNEAGLSAALFYFPKYGEYKPYDAAMRDQSIGDLQLVSWVLANCATIDDVRNALQNVRVINIDSRADTVHWRFTEKNGRQVVLEIVGGIPQFYDSTLGVLTNAPGYPWQKTNLNNYVNLVPGTAGPIDVNGVQLTAFGSGSGFHGLPGDFTPPSRFVRASFLSSYSLKQKTAFDSAMQAFHILNNFDVPTGVQFAVGRAPNNMPSATQWTIATDLKNMVIYYHTMYDRTVRSIDMSAIDFGAVAFQTHPLDTNKRPTIMPAQIDYVAPIVVETDVTVTEFME